MASTIEVVSAILGCETCSENNTGTGEHGVNVTAGTADFLGNRKDHESANSCELWRSLRCYVEPATWKP